MVMVSLVQAKAHLSELLDKVEAGEEVIITRRGRAMAHIHAVSPPKHPLRLDDLAAFCAKSGNSQAVRIPAEPAYADTDIDL